MAKAAAAHRNRTLTDHNARSPAAFSVQPYVVVYTTMDFELTDENVVALFAPNGLRHRQFVCIYVSTSTRKIASNLTTRSQSMLDAMAPRIMQGFANVAVCLERENSKRRFPGPTLQVRIASVALGTVSISKLERLCAPMVFVREGMRVRCCQPLCTGLVTVANRMRWWHGPCVPHLLLKAALFADPATCTSCAWLRDGVGTVLAHCFASWPRDCRRKGVGHMPKQAYSIFNVLPSLRRSAARPSWSTELSYLAQLMPRACSPCIWSSINADKGPMTTVLPVVHIAGS